MQPEPSAKQSIAAMVSASETARLKGDYGQGARFAKEAADLAASLGLQAEQADALRLLANQLSRTGAMEEAAEACVRAAEIEAAIGNEAGQARSLTLLALVYSDLGLQEEALQSLTVSLEIAQRLRDPELLFWTYNRIGTTQASMNNYSAARDFLLRALPLSTGLGAEAKFCIRNNLADTAVQLAEQASAKGDGTMFREAIESGLADARDALELARAASHPYREAICLANYGMLLAFAGDRPGAEQATIRSHAIATRMGYASLILDATNNLARIAGHYGDVEIAIDRFEAVLPQLIANDEKPLVLRTHERLSELYNLVDRAAEALDHYKSFHALEVGMRTGVAETRAKMMTGMTELNSVRLEAERAKLEATLQRMRLAELEAERRDLLTRARDLDRQANEDDLTGLKNRRYAYGALNERLSHPAGDAAVCIGIIDADHFKAINDSFGHTVGDDVLRRLATILAGAMSDRGFAARLGGEEFLLVFDGLSPAESLRQCDEVRLAIAGADWSDIAGGLGVTVSIGVAAAAPGETPFDILSRADSALYRAKGGGRNRVTADPPAR